MAKHDFAGIWHMVYHFTSSRRPGNFNSEYKLKITEEGSHITMDSLPNTEQSHMFVRATLNGRILTGTWQENTSPEGFYKGMVYEGAVQLAIDQDNRRMVGKWLTYGSDGKVGAGDWEMTRLKDNEDLEKHAKQHAKVG